MLKNKHLIKNSFVQQAGFTLLEMTVSMGVFLVLFTLTLSIYSSTLNTERQSVQLSKLQKEAQLIMEIIAKKIRTGKVDYDFYTPLSQVDSVNGETELALLDKYGNPTLFRYNNNSLEVCTLECGTQSAPNNDNFNVIPASDIIINSLTFFIVPATNPFTTNNQNPEFPKVTVVVNLENTIGKATRNLIIQQTVPQRLPGP